MAYHHTQRQAKGGLGSAILFVLLAIAGGSFIAVTMDDGSPAARVHLAEDFSASTAVR